MAPTNMLQCTGRYSGLVKNGLGGTLDKPCADGWGLYCSKADVDAWHGVAEDLWQRLRSRWSATAGAEALPQEVITYVTQIESDYCTSDSDGLCTKYWLPQGSWWDTRQNAQAAAKIAGWCSRVACALELLDNVRGVTGPARAAPDEDLGFGYVGNLDTPRSLAPATAKRPVLPRSTAKEGDDAGEQSDAAADGEDEFAKLEAVVAGYGPGDAIGRWGAVQSTAGRTVGEPCQGIADMCSDYDVDFWLADAKSWIGGAEKIRETNIVAEWGRTPSEWPHLARLGEHAYQRARDIVAGDLGFFNKDKVATLQLAQRWAKIALEMYTRAVEQEVGKNIDMSKYKELTHDTVSDPEDRPAVIPPPKLPQLPDFGLYFKLGAGAVIAVSALGIVYFVVGGKEKDHG